MTKTYRTKELSELTSVTIRTLHYYDEIELLTPSSKSQSGHRFYSEDDMFRLQQITTLKFLGFSLEQIQQIISNPQFNIQESLRTQAKIISDEAKRLNHAANLMRNLVNQLDFDETVNWKTIAKITEVIQMGEIHKEKWHEKYLSSPELKELQEITNHYSADFWEIYNRKWAVLYNEVEANLHTSPESETGMVLAKKCLELVDEVFPRTSSLRKKLWAACKAGVYPEDSLPSQQVIHYIAKATEKFKRDQNRLN